jgi:hypothetical protein
MGTKLITMAVCKQCKDKFIPKYFLQKHCMKNDVCVRAELDMKYAQKQKQEKKALKEDTAERKEKLMSKKDYIKLLQVVVNAYIRKRDEHLPCISCGTFKAEEFHAGHYIATTYQYLRFNEKNIWKQCSKCNTHLRGNSIPYRIELINRIGLEEVERLENDRHKTLEITIDEIKEKITHYKTLTKKLNK